MSSLNIVVVEDNDELCDATVEALRDMGHVVRGVTTALALDNELAGFPADLLLLDLNLHGEDGLSVARRLRAAQPDIGIIMITARARNDDKIAGYESGADLYLTKPVSVDVLGAAIRSIARRLRPSGLHDNPTHGITLSSITLQLHGPLATVDVSKRECLLLDALAQADVQLQDNAHLIAVSGIPADEHSKSTLEVQIVRLRKKLEQAGASAPTIKAIRGIGYQLCFPLEIQRSTTFSKSPHHA
jgi:DNA-binding response OmpR family regulator